MEDYELNEIDWMEITGDREQHYGKYDVSKIFQYLETQHKQGVKTPVITQRTVKNLLGIRNNAYANQLLHRLIAQRKLVRFKSRNYQGYLYTEPKYIPKKYLATVIEICVNSVINYWGYSDEERENLRNWIKEVEKNE